MTKKARKLECAPHRTITKVSKVKVEEHGKSAVFLNPKRVAIHVTEVDGELVEHERSADFAVSKPGVGDVIVELKGKEVGHACEQILATAALLKSCRKTPLPIAGLVVCTRSPATDTRTQRLKAEFFKKHKTILKVCASNKEYRFEDFFGA